MNLEQLVRFQSLNLWHLRLRSWYFFHFCQFIILFCLTFRIKIWIISNYVLTAQSLKGHNLAPSPSISFVLTWINYHFDSANLMKRQRSGSEKSPRYFASLRANDLSKCSQLPEKPEVVTFSFPGHRVATCENLTSWWENEKILYQQHCRETLKYCT